MKDQKVVDMADMARFISEKSEVDIDIVLDVLEAEFIYLLAKGLVKL